MKKLLLTSAILFLAITINAQIFGTAQTLSTKKFNVGIMPAVIVNEGAQEYFLFIQAGYGLASGVDLGLRFNVFSENTYLGADLEFALKRNLSVATGFHSFNNDLGLDLTGLLTIPLNQSARLTSGLDMDIIFMDGENKAPLWIPINFEVDLKRNMTFMLEADIDTKLLDESYHVLSAGIQFYF
ncbi:MULTISPECIES: hypothetical protein [unclassified Saccharicrinis]|uniref:hypothetical protein n=1 Tax=unclassified Saccharicrinis TaxID=2646859 RepID=UPI003D347AAB